MTNQNDTVEEWKADGDFVANLYGLIRGMDTVRKTEVLKFVEYSINRCLTEERKRVLELLKDYDGFEMARTREKIRNPDLLQTLQ